MCTPHPRRCAPTSSGLWSPFRDSERILSGPLRTLSRAHARELEWSGVAGTGALLASALRTLGRVRFEVTENPSRGNDGSRWSFTPDLGIFHATTDVAGNIVVSEDRIRYAYEAAAGDPTLLLTELSVALGESWDEELEPFRHAAEGAPVRWLHRVS